MKKAYEIFLILIIFYGVYSAFGEVIHLLAPETGEFVLIVISLLVATGLLLLYSQVVAVSAKRKVKQKMKGTISTLETKVQETEQRVAQKESELKNAFKLKKAVEDEAQETL